MEPENLENYLLEQARIEVDYTRSWPNNLLAFYVAINFGLAGALLTLAGGEKSFHISTRVAASITFLIVVAFIWTAALLVKNHLSYLRHRNIQIQFQINNLKEITERKYSLPDDWTRLNKISIFERPLGWLFYLFITVIVTAITISGVWVAQCL